MNDVGGRPGRWPKIEVLYIEGCPHWQDAVRLVRSAADDVGAAGAEVSTTLVRTPEQAAELGFAGSPTILVAGRNPFPGAPVGALACRLFQTSHGLDGLPDRDELADAIQAASASPSDPPQA